MLFRSTAIRSWLETQTQRPGDLKLTKVPPTGDISNGSLAAGPGTWSSWGPGCTLSPAIPGPARGSRLRWFLLPGWDPPLPRPRHQSADSWSSISAAIRVLKLEGAERPFRPTVSSLQMKKLRPRGSKGCPPPPRPASTEGRCAAGLATVEMLGHGGRGACI